MRFGFSLEFDKSAAWSGRHSGLGKVGGVDVGKSLDLKEPMDFIQF
jgi:hypothetical protein